MKKLIILDRDGVINQDSPEYVKSVDEFVLLPGSVDAIARLNAADYFVAVATNQSGISRGLYDERELNAIHDKMFASIESHGGHIDALEYCPHMPDSGCPCRKPKPGLLYKLANYLKVPLKNVIFVGDRITDIQAAYAAGAQPIMVLSSMTDIVGLTAYPNVPVFNSLTQYVDTLLSS